MNKLVAIYSEELNEVPGDIKKWNKKNPNTSVVSVSSIQDEDVVTYIIYIETITI